MPRPLVSDCRILLFDSGADLCWALGGDNLQFYPNFALFSTLGGMNLDHNFVQVWKFSEDQKNANGTLFSQIQVKTKKRVFIKNRTFFPQFLLRCTPIQIIGGDTAKLLGGYILPSPLVSAPLLFDISKQILRNICSCIFQNKAFARYVLLVISGILY